MAIFLIAVASAVMVVVATLHLAPDDPNGMAPHLPTLAGGVFVLGSFMLLPWISFEFLDYFAGPAQIVANAAPVALSALLHLLGQETLVVLLGLLKKFGSVPGWLLPLVVAPMAGVRHSIALFLGPIVSTVSLVWLTAVLIGRPGAGIRRSMGWLQFVFALTAWIILLLEIPLIDSMGTQSNFAAHFFVVASGARMTGWVWFAWIGLLLLVIGGLLEATGMFQRKSDEAPGA